MVLVCQSFVKLFVTLTLVATHLTTGLLIINLGKATLMLPSGSQTGVDPRRTTHQPDTSRCVPEAMSSDSCLTITGLDGVI